VSGGGARASHAAVVVDGGAAMWVVGGVHFQSNFSDISVLNLSSNVWTAVDALNAPYPRYDHSLVEYQASQAYAFYETPSMICGLCCFFCQR
jgi:hypothetical protein